MTNTPVNKRNRSSHWAFKWLVQIAAGASLALLGLTITSNTASSRVRAQLEFGSSECRWTLRCWGLGKYYYSSNEQYFGGCGC